MPPVSTGTFAAASSLAIIQASAAPPMISFSLYALASLSADSMSSRRLALITTGNLPASTGCSASRSALLAEYARVPLASYCTRLVAYIFASSSTSRSLSSTSAREPKVWPIDSAIAAGALRIIASALFPVRSIMAA